jgi:hypothetical protein
MKTLRITEERQHVFLAKLAEWGDLAAAAAAAGTTRTGAEELRANDPEFASAWAKAIQASADNLEQVARRRALEGLIEPVLSDGKVVRDDNGQPIVVRRYSDVILLALLKAQHPEKFNEWKFLSEVLYPRWIKSIAIILVSSLAIWAIGSLILFSIFLAISFRVKG